MADAPTPLRRALLVIEELEARLARAESAAGGREAVAVVGVGCRFPGGADGPDATWRLLRDGVFAGGEAPRERFDPARWYDPDPAAPGKTDVRVGGFLPHIDRFDAAFFGIAPREAVAMDPQQRLLLEVAWEALEHAAIPPADLAGSKSGVFVGLYNQNYTLAARGSDDPAVIDGWSAGGSHTSIAAGRLSYTLGLHGPSLAVDTACSSSLVAVHLALHSLRRGECDVALAGGVHLVVSPRSLVAATKLGVTAGDGRAKVFDAAADGFGQGEGCGVVVLKRLADAVRAGDRVLAVLLGSAVNQDGRSTSLTAPNGRAQAALLRAALADAGVDPGAVGYVEAHGTGTPLGDPVEVGALAEVFAPGRDPAAPLLFGSVKTNLGHLEAAAGIAGLVKAVLAVGHGEVPPHLHFSRLNPAIELAGFPAAVPTARTAWPVAGRRIAGVSAFGFGGTNAHVVVAEAPEEADASVADDPRAQLVCLAARDETALAELARSTADLLAADGAPALADVAYTSQVGRTPFPWRLAVAAADAAGAAAALRRAAETADRTAAHGAARGRAGDEAPRVGFLFTGQGAPIPGAGRELYDREPRFRAVVERCAEVFAAERPDEPPLPALMFDAGRDLAPTRLAQPALYALQVALLELWRGWGIRPAAVVGHSVGEVAAAVAAGVLDVADGMRFVARRAAAMDAVAGGMLAVLAGEEAVRAAASDVDSGELDGEVAVAAVNGATTVLAGPDAALAALAERLAAAGLETRPLQVSGAFHSPAMEPVLDRLEAAAEMPHAAPAVPFVSGLDGAPRERLGAAYWRLQARRPVRFADAVRALPGLGCDALLELGPRPTLLGLARGAGVELPGLASLRPGRGERQAMLAALGELWTRGAEVDWPALHADAEGHVHRRRVTLPTYPFQRRRFWLEEPGIPVAAAAAAPADDGDGDVGDGDVGDPVVYGYYDGLSVVADDDAERAADDSVGHLSYGVFAAPVPGFSWVRALFGLGGAADGERMRRSQRELKDFLFRHVDFAAVGAVFDFGCGHAADLATLARRHPHLRLAGYTLSARQVEVGRRRLAALGVGDRVRVERRDSGRDPFPGTFELIYGVEVSGLIADKEALFDNVAGHLAPGGMVVIADFAAPGGRLVAPDTGAVTSSPEEWADLLADRKLRLLDCVDASREVASFLVDAEFAANLDEVAARRGLDEITVRHLRASENIGRALRGGIMRYLLLTAQHEPLRRRDDVRAENRARLAAPTPYGEARRGSSAAEPWRGWLYETAWRHRPLPAAARLPSPVDVAPRLEPARAAAEATLQEHAALGPALDRLAAGYAAAAFRALGCRDLAEARRAEVAPRHRRLRDRLADVLAEDGLDPLPATAQVDRLDDDAAALAERFPAAAAELTMLRRCGGELAAVLVGRVDPLELLFPGGDADDAAAIYVRSPFARGMSELAAAALAALQEVAGDAPLRVLEVGGGTGGSTAALLGRLAPGATYLFTDVAPSLVERAGRELAGVHPGLACRAFDVAADPAAQGLAEGSFDVVVAANVLHVTPDLAVTLGHVRRLLAPGGVLLLVETTGHLRWGDVTFGLTPGMWAFRDGRDYALLTQAAWRRALAGAGFADLAVAAPGEADRGGVGQQALFLARRAPASHRVAVVGGDAGPSVAELVAALAAAGHAATAVADGETIAEDVTDVVHVGALDAPLDDTVDDTADDTADAAFAGLDRLHGALAVAQELAARAAPPRLWLVARGANGVETTAADPAQAALWGFRRALAREHAELDPRLVDLDPALPAADQTGVVVAELAAAEGDAREPETAWRGGRRRVPRLVPGTWPSAAAPAPRDTTLITGGLGGLGLAVARWAVDAGARHLVLAGRSAPSPAAEATLAELRDAGAEVWVRRVDVGDGAALSALLAEIDAALPPLRTVVHAAGVVADAALAGQSPERLRAVFRAKADGTWNLHRATAGRELDAFLLFSSAAATLGSAGQTNHAAANAFVDGVAELRRAAGLPALAIAWGAWGEVGAAASADLDDAVARRGLRHMAPDAAVAAFAAVRGHDAARVALLDADWATVAGDRPPALLAELVVSDSARAAPASAKPTAPVTRAAEGELATRLAATPAGRRRDVLLAEVRRRAARVMGLAPEDVADPRAALRDLGLDSLMAVELRNDLATALGRRLPSTLLFEHPTCAALADHLLGEEAEEDLSIAEDDDLRRFAAELEAAESILGGAR